MNFALDSTVPESDATARGTVVGDEIRPFEAEPGWDDFVGSHPSSHVLQLEGWARLKQRVGWQVHQAFLADAGGTYRAGALMLQQRRLGLSLGYVPGGPLVDWSRPADVDDMRTELLRCARMHGMHVVKIEPELQDTPAHRRQLARLGFRPGRQTVQPRSTIKVDLAGSDADLLGRMKSKWRYNVRRAQRAGTQVRVGGSSDLERLHALMQATGRRQGFAPHAPAYFEAAFELLPNHLELLLAEVQGETVAAVVLALCGGSAWYLWGASSARHRHAMPNYALHFTAMQRARAAGARTYDLWGIPDPLGAVAAAMREAQGQGAWPDSLPVDLARLPQRDLWTVYRMKQGFGGRIERRVGAWDLPVDELAWRGYAVAVDLQDQVRPALSAAQRHLSTGLGGRLPRGTVPLGSCSDIADPVVWNEAIVGCVRPGWQQSWQAGETARQAGWSVRRWMLHPGAERPDVPVQVMAGRMHRTVPLSLAEVRDGPCPDWRNLVEAADALGLMESLLVEEGCIGIRISPRLRVDTASGMAAVLWLEANGWHPVANGHPAAATWVSPLAPGEARLSEAGAEALELGAGAAERAGFTVDVGNPVHGHHARFLAAVAWEQADQVWPGMASACLSPTGNRLSDDDGDYLEARVFVVEDARRDPVTTLVAARFGRRVSIERVHQHRPVNLDLCPLAGRSVLEWARTRDCVEVDWGRCLPETGGPEVDGADPDLIPEGLGAVRVRWAGTWQKWLRGGEWLHRVPRPIIERVWTAR